MKIQKPSLLPVILFALGLLATAARAETVSAVFNSPADVPVTASSYTAAGNTVNFTLNFAPEVGTELMVVKNTGLPFLNGTFDNLAQGQLVTLTYGGTNYYFAANYYGGSGNDLVLLWASSRVCAWGYNQFGQLGNGTDLQVSPFGSTSPVAVDTSGVLRGRTLVAVSACNLHSLGLCLDGTVASWGMNLYGELGDGTTAQREVPVRVNTTPGLSALAGKRAVAVVAGGIGSPSSFSLALCSDGSVATWGDNISGQLGDNSTVGRYLPVAVNMEPGVSALSGKTAIALAAGSAHSVALCSDGTVAAWGANSNGQLGDNTTTKRKVPVTVNTDSGVSALYGKTVVAIAAGATHTLALCSDGTVAAWGANSSGQLGDNTTTQRTTPVAVNTEAGISALCGKTVVAIAAGGSYSLALCSDGTLASWGANNNGQLGDTTTTQRNAPVAVNTEVDVSALYGKSVAGVAAGQTHSLAWCSDGTVAAWGNNGNGQLGDGTTTKRFAPVAVSSSTLAAGERFARAATGMGALHAFALVAGPAVPGISVEGNGVEILNGDGAPSPVKGTDFGSAPVNGGPVVRTFVIRNLGAAPLNLTGTLRVAVSGPHAADFAVTAQPGSPVAGGGTTPFQVAFTPSAAWLRTATLTIVSDDPSVPACSFAIQGTGTGVLSAGYSTGTEAPLSASGFTATGSTVSLALNYPPAPGTELTVVENPGLGWLSGTFDNLTNGQPVTLSYGGTNYTFVANYYGGNGNDLVLTWASDRAFAWGDNTYGQLGDNTSGNSRRVAVPVTATGVLAGKTIVSLSAGVYHSLALCSDGTVAAWGQNTYGQLGDNTTTLRKVPVAANLDAGVSALYGKRVVAVAAGYQHSLALCSDGTVAGWGYNYYGQLGDNTTTTRLAPAAVSSSEASALCGKTVVAIAVGKSHSLALCSDGTVAAWGDNNYGQLGNRRLNAGKTPVAVSTASGVSALHGKTVMAISAGASHNLALCSDGTLAAWGQNGYGQLGDNTRLTRDVPVAVNTASGISALYGKTVVAISAGTGHSLALCSDGTMVAWGGNSGGQCGDNTSTDRLVPVAVNRASGLSGLYGKTVVSIAAGGSQSLALCSDRTLAAWGANLSGQLGDNSTTTRYAPVVVNTAPLATSQRFAGVFGGSSASHSLALVAAPPATNITLASITKLPGGSFQCGFANTPGAFFSAVRTADLSLLSSDWIPVGDATEVSLGQFQFTDPGATNSPQRFYRVRSP